MITYKCTEWNFGDNRPELAAIKEKWLSIAKTCPYATYFHTPYWYDLIVPNGDYSVIEVSFDDGVCAVIPIAKAKRFGGFFVDHHSSPCGNYGGWISAASLGEEHAQILTEILLSKKNLTWRINPFDSLSAALLSALALPRYSKLNVSVKDEFTHTLDLTLPEDELYRKTSRCHKRGLRRAAGGGVVVRPVDAWEDWERHYALYEESLRRWRAGGPELKTRMVYPLELFRRIYENRTGNETLWLASQNGQPIAGLLCFYWNRHSVSWHGAASSDFFDLRPNNILYWEAILDARRRGYEIFDFNPSGGYEGVESFKDRFGPARVPSSVLTTRTPLRSLISRLRSSFRRSR